MKHLIFAGEPRRPQHDAYVWAKFADDGFGNMIPKKPTRCAFWSEGYFE